MSYELDGQYPTPTLGLRRRAADKKFDLEILNKNFEKVDHALGQYGSKNGFDPVRMRRRQIAYFDADAGITLDWDSSYIRKMGPMAFIELNFKPKARIRIGGTGNNAAFTVGRIREGWLPLAPANLSVGSTGRANAGYMAETGTVSLSAVASDRNSLYLEKDETISMQGIYFMRNSKVRP